MATRSLGWMAVNPEAPPHLGSVGAQSSSWFSGEGGTGVGKVRIQIVLGPLRIRELWDHLVSGGDMERKKGDKKKWG